MNSKEQQLEEISEKMGRSKIGKELPVFEMFITMVSISLSIVMFLFPNMFSSGVSSSLSPYGFLLVIMPQFMWALTFFCTGILKAVGMLISSRGLRIGGIVLSSLVYGVIAVIYSIGFPTIESVVFTALTVFSLLSISEVKRTGLQD